METETSRTICRHRQDEENWRRRCGCLRTSEKLKQILDTFPPPPPPTPEPKEAKTMNTIENSCISAYCTVHQPVPPTHNKNVKICCEQLEELQEEVAPKKTSVKSWRVFKELAQLIHLSITATALVIYYIIYCYMQLIYFTLRSALYFHNADGPMKITIAVVTITSIIVGFNVILKLEKLIKVY